MIMFDSLSYLFGDGPKTLLSDWTKLEIIGVATFTVLLVGAIFAVLNWFLAKEKIKIDLWKIRYEFYKEAVPIFGPEGYLYYNDSRERTFQESNNHNLSDERKRELSEISTQWDMYFNAQNLSESALHLKACSLCLQAKFLFDEKFHRFLSDSFVGNYGKGGMDRSWTAPGKYGPLWAYELDNFELEITRFIRLDGRSKTRLRFDTWMAQKKDSLVMWNAGRIFKKKMWE